MNEHQQILWQNMVDLIESYIDGQTEDFYGIVGKLEGALDAAEIEDNNLIKEWYDVWIPLEIQRSTENNNIDKSKALERLKNMKKFLLSKRMTF